MLDQHSTLTSFSQCICVVLVSGGMDSAACIDFYQRQGFAVRGLHMTYGQPAARREAAAATAIAHRYGIPLTVIQIVGARPKSDGELLGRNALLLFTALMEIDDRSAILALGVHSGTPYYDCSSSFLTAVQSIIDGQCDGRIRVVAPFLEWTKKEIWDYSLEHRVPIDLTYSCERGLDHPLWRLFVMPRSGGTPCLREARQSDIKHPASAFRLRCSSLHSPAKGLRGRKKTRNPRSERSLLLPGSS